MTFHAPLCMLSCVQECVGVMEGVKLYCDGENHSSNEEEFMWNDIVVKRMSASFYNYQVIFQRLASIKKKLFPT
jgi:hypothetical protein